MAYKVIKSSPFTSIQDRGRFGFSYMGISNSGAMDEYAFNFSNKLLNNKYNTNSLEILWGGLVLESYTNSSFVITGADFNVTLNDIKINNWETYEIKIGDILKFNKKTSGQRAYFTVKGGFFVDKELGSAATSYKEKIGGVNDGEFIKKGDFLLCKRDYNFKKRVLKKLLIPTYRDKLTIRVIESYQNELFSQEAKDIFFSTEFTITKDFNNMACKLNGEKVKTDIMDIISEGIAFGSIQIPPSGEPIILLKERQTIGGYPKIGTAIALDCFRLSQMNINSKIRFKRIDLKKAQDKLRTFYKYFNS